MTATAWLDRQFQDILRRFGGNHSPRRSSERSPERISLLRFQMERLAATVERAAQTSFYSRRLDDGGAFLIRRLRRLEEAAVSEAGLEEILSAVLAELPLTRPEELAAAPEQFLAVSLSSAEGVISVPSSGSAGASKRIYSTVEDLENSISFFQYGMRYLVQGNASAGDRVALIMSGSRPGSVGDLVSRALERLDTPCLVPGFPPALEEEEGIWLQRLLEWRPTCLIGVPGQVLALARHPLGEELGRTLKTVLLSGETAPFTLTEALRDNWNVEVFLHYGLTEFGLGGAVECGLHTGPHLREADLLAEILDPQGNPVTEYGQRGELALTSLSRCAMPIIRYRTGDIAALSPADCPCGSIMRRLHTFGRQADRICLPDGRRLSLRDLAEVLYAFPFIRAFQAVQRDDPPALILRLTAGGREKTPATAAERIRAALPLGGLPLEIEWGALSGGKLVLLPAC